MANGKKRTSPALAGCSKAIEIDRHSEGAKRPKNLIRQVDRDSSPSAQNDTSSAASIFKQKVDLQWDDSHVLPPKVTPDLVFLFDRMVEVTIGKVKAINGQRVLDIGCGRAADAIKIAQNGGTLVGLEPSTVMLNQGKKCIAESDTDVALVQGIGETLPFKANSFDWIICKGSLDHFPDPSKAIEEMSRGLKPEGKVIISLANFESLGHRLGKSAHHAGRFITRRKTTERQAWETPPDHTYRFDYSLMKKMISTHLEIEESIGISFLWGAPLWDRITSIPPRKISFFILNTLDKLARRLPSLSDVVLMKCRHKKSNALRTI